MPATKIETGVHLELKRLQLLPNARKHRPDKITSLAESIKQTNAQLQDIIVCPRDEAAGANSRTCARLPCPPGRSRSGRLQQRWPTTS